MEEGKPRVDLLCDGSSVIIDCHTHYTTAPPQFKAWRDRQVAAIRDGAQAPSPDDLAITDDEIRESIEHNQLKVMIARGSDLTVLSPRASFMAHHIGDLRVSLTWSRICNDLCYRVTKLFPQYFALGAMLPQSPGVPPSTVIPELRRAVEELGAVCVNLNPDPTGGFWNGPPLTDPTWYPVYEALTELDVPAMLHVSTTCNPAFHTTGSHYLNADTAVFMQLLESDLFAHFPTLQFVIPHGGGAVPYHWGRFRGIAMRENRPGPESLLSNIFFDTCVYHQPGIDLLAEVIPTQNLLFASEMIGAVRGVDPDTGNYFDDTKRYLDSTPHLDESQRAAIFEGNVRQVYPRLDTLLKSQGR